MTGLYIKHMPDWLLQTLEFISAVLERKTVHMLPNDANALCMCHGRSLGSPPEVAKHIHTTWTLS